MTHLIRSVRNEDSRDIIFNIWINEYHFQVSPEDYSDLHKIEAHYTSTFRGSLTAFKENHNNK